MDRSSRSPYLNIDPYVVLHKLIREKSASLPSSFAPQGWFPPVKCISSLLFSSTGMISTARMHLYLALLLHKDYFRRPDASLSCSFVPQGLFRPTRFISILLFCPTGIILPQPDASLSSSFTPQGLFPPVEFISIWLFCSTGIISAARIHPSPALLLHRDYFAPVRCVPTSEKNRNLCFLN